MLRWISSPVYSRYDAIWLCMFAIALHESHFIAAIAVIVLGAVSSAVLELSANKENRNA